MSLTATQIETTISVVDKPVIIEFHGAQCRHVSNVCTRPVKALYR